jgi:hypothetical protein
MSPLPRPQERGGGSAMGLERSGSRLIGAGERTSWTPPSSTSQVGSPSAGGTTAHERSSTSEIRKNLATVGGAHSPLPARPLSTRTCTIATTSRSEPRASTHPPPHVHSPPQTHNPVSSVGLVTPLLFFRLAPQGAHAGSQHILARTMHDARVVLISILPHVHAHALLIASQDFRSGGAPSSPRWSDGDDGASHRSSPIALRRLRERASSETTVCPLNTIASQLRSEFDTTADEAAEAIQVRVNSAVSRAHTHRHTDTQTHRHTHTPHTRARAYRSWPSTPTLNARWTLSLLASSSLLYSGCLTAQRQRKSSLRCRTLEQHTTR